MATQLDCKGLRCPMPIVKLGLAIRQLKGGDRIHVEATDPAFDADLAAWARKTGHTIIQLDGDSVRRAVIEKAA